MTLLIPFLTFVLIALTILGIWVSGVRMSRTWLPDDESRPAGNHLCSSAFDGSIKKGIEH